MAVQWADPKPTEWEHGWDIDLREDTVAHVEDGKLVILGWYCDGKHDGWRGEFDIGESLNVCYDPDPMNSIVTNRRGFGPFPVPSDEFALLPFEIVTNPIGSRGMDRKKLEEAGVKVVDGEIDKFVRAMLEGGADKVWRIWRRHVVALPADTAEHIGMMIFCQLAMLGVK